jgi:hypothetical protein
MNGSLKVVPNTCPSWARKRLAIVLSAVCISTALLSVESLPALSPASFGASGNVSGPHAVTGPAAYWEVASDGGIFSYGNAPFYGSAGSLKLNKAIVGMAATPDDGGYWLVASDGGIFSYGDAQFYGSTGSIHLDKPIVGMAATPDGGGYWLVASDGGIFSYGDAQFYGSMGGQRLNAPIVGMDTTSSGSGYWLVASDGGIFNFGNAGFFGSSGALHLNKAIVGMAATPDGGGYWLTGSDGGIFNYGDAGFFGSTGSIRLNRPVVSVSSTADGLGYWLVASDGGIFSYGDADFSGSAGGMRLNAPIVDMATVSPLSVTDEVYPNQTTTVSLGQYSLTIPPGVVSQPTTATITQLTADPNNQSGPGADFSIDADWENGSNSVTVTLPLDPDLASLGTDWQPGILHYPDGSFSPDIYFGSNVDVDEGNGTIRTNVTSLSPLISTSLFLPILQDVSILPNRPSDVEDLLVPALHDFLGLRASQPNCSPDITNVPGLTYTAGSATQATPWGDHQTALLYCTEPGPTQAGGVTTATWYLANNSATVLNFTAGGGTTITTGESGDPLTDLYFTQLNKDTPSQVLVPPGGEAIVTVASSVTPPDVLTVSSYPLVNPAAFILHEVTSFVPPGDVGQIAGLLYSCVTALAQDSDINKFLQCAEGAAPSLLDLGQSSVFKVLKKGLALASLFADAGLTIADTLNLSGTLEADLTYTPTEASGLPATVTVPGDVGWTDTGLSIPSGTTITITASGVVGGMVDDGDPAGTPWSECEGDNASGPYPVPGLPCWSMIGRFGSAGTPFEVGDTTTVVSSGGELYLGVNDNLLSDNTGSWTANVASG